MVPKWGTGWFLGGAASSLRGAKRRSNPDGGVLPGLPRFARNDVGDGRNDAPSLRGAGRPRHCEEAATRLPIATKQSRRGRPFTGLLRFARNDEGARSQ
ncbi:MAG: hypothetical protein LBT00_13865 [Spirochaetaceae bacterium]|nr:hypothetical protein [Spirochaetaceae bacterium]